MYRGFWMEFVVLWIGAILGSVAILPYSLRLVKESPKKMKLSGRALFLLSILQNAVLFAILTAVGLIVAHQIGLNSHGALQATPDHILSALILGVLAGAFLLVADLFFVPYFPEKLLNTALKTTQMENFTASFYGGINEELFARLFGVSVVAWLISRVWHTGAGLPTTGVFWLANIIMAVFFALGHLPALRSLMEKITPAMLTRTLLLNIPVGLICGWLFWNYGIVTAMIAHFAADIIYHLGGTYVLRRKFAKKS